MSKLSNLEQKFKSQKHHHHHSKKNEDPIIKSGTKNWATDLALSNVRNQKSCGSCWAFSANTLVEYAFKIEQNKDIDLSDQQLVSCTFCKVFGDCTHNGCNGGWISYPLHYMKYLPITT